MGHRPRTVCLPRIEQAAGVHSLNTQVCAVAAKTVSECGMNWLYLR